ncbi:MAG: hypothetical protein ACI8TP_004674, partial [Acidimicrobiales bacterium]
EIVRVCSVGDANEQSLHRLTAVVFCCLGHVDTVRAERCDIVGLLTD